MAGKVTKLKAPGKAAVSAASEPEPKTNLQPRLQLRMRDVLERVVDRSGMRKGEARTAIETTLAVVAEAIENGEDLDLPGLGKLKLQRERETPRGKAYVLKLIRNAPAAAGNQPLAEDEKGG